MNERVKALRKLSVETRPFISSERAELITDFYQSGICQQVSVPMCRALAFRYILRNKAIAIGPFDLIVGNRGPGPKATPTYPELCCHSLEDLEIMHKRQRTPYIVSEQVRQVYKEKIIPFWTGRTMREKVFAAMSEPWQQAFEAGVFTEFMEQRAPGHAILDDKIYQRGLLDFKRDIADSRARLDYYNDPLAWEKDQELQAIDICADAIIEHAQRYSRLARQMATAQSDAKRKVELENIAEICSRVPAEPPRTFHEALQAYWFIHLAVITELNTWDSFNPGRLDQHLYPFYKKQIAESKTPENASLTKEHMRELLQCFWIKFNDQPAPPKVGITEEQSGTYTDFALINCGGLKADGSDAVNEVSYLILDVVEEMQLVQPSSCIQLSSKNQNRFLKRACRVVRTGLGQPSIFNADVILKEMLHDGKSMEDGRNGGPSGCVTISAFGKESCTLTGYCNWAKILELALNNGVNPATGMQLGPKTGNPETFKTFDDLMNAYNTQLRYFIDLKIKGNNIIERLYANFMPTPVMSLVMNDCIARGLDYHNGGARYNPTYIQGVGMGSLTDSLAALRYHVFDRQTVSISQMKQALASNFDGFEDLRKVLQNQSPKYGNDDAYADEIASWVFELYYQAVNGRANTKGGKYRVNLLPTTVHIYFGSVVGALPCGRLAGQPLSDGISPSQGADTQGPTAIVKSAARIDHARTGGTLLNMKFNPQVLQGPGLDKLVHLIRSYFNLDGHHIQFNVVGRDTLCKAQDNPQEYRNLIVRVAGYSDYFVDLGRDLQNEIIARTEHQTIN